MISWAKPGPSSLTATITQRRPARFDNHLMSGKLGGILDDVAQSISDAGYAEAWVRCSNALAFIAGAVSTRIPTSPARNGRRYSQSSPAD